MAKPKLQTVSTALVTQKQHSKYVEPEQNWRGKQVKDMLHPPPPLTVEWFQMALTPRRVIIQGDDGHPDAQNLYILTPPRKFSWHSWFRVGVLVLLIAFAFFAFAYGPRFK